MLPFYFSTFIFPTKLFPVMPGFSATPQLKEALMKFAL